MIGKKCVIRKEITAEIFEKFRNLHGWGKRAQKHKVLFLNIIQIIVFLGDVFLMINCFGNISAILNKAPRI